ncbi:MAG: 6-carboxytetrahydropterin synthase QueD [Thiobacillaceae bacterium]|nr:6-carboxytetrahydropterin synthase QueD [Thiobacillaceae bacterium]MCX7672453.1 6-carboxytetrahydropterin synthase QueD [Thiobacillaceae bacterium]MDW8323115.1 6-carboxytetrahydropterin synthase QueD [Burkholderiales bacterium]
MQLFHVFRFEAARRLPHLPPEHPCARLHGHSFRVEVHVCGPLDAHLGWVMDFAELTAACARLKAQLDHRYLNDLPGLANPTSEHLAIWIWQQLKTVVPGLCRVVVQETADSGCIYTGE